MAEGVAQSPTYQFCSQGFPFRKNRQQRVNEIETSTGWSWDVHSDLSRFRAGRPQPHPPAEAERAVLQCKQIYSEQGTILEISRVFGCKE